MNAIVLAALGSVEDTILDSVTRGLQRAFQFPVRVLPALPDPSFAYDAQRGQYSSVLILRDLLEQVSGSTIRVLGVTERDLFIPMLSFVLGQAQLNGPTAAISLARLRQEFYGLPPDAGLLQSRAVKEAVHEIGHTFGLIHCTDSRCPMSLSNTVRHVDAKGPDLCATCATLFEERKPHMRLTDDRSDAARKTL